MLFFSGVVIIVFLKQNSTTQFTLVFGKSCRLFQHYSKYAKTKLRVQLVFPQFLFYFSPILQSTVLNSIYSKIPQQTSRHERGSQVISRTKQKHGRTRGHVIRIHRSSDVIRLARTGRKFGFESETSFAVRHLHRRVSQVGPARRKRGK